MDTEALKRSLLKKFKEVTEDRLQKIQLAVLDLEKPTSVQAAEDLARELHTMKGEARMLGLPAIGQIAHAAEDLLKAANEGKAPKQVATDLLLRACDLVADLVDDLEGAHSGTPVSQAMCEALAQASGHAVPLLKPGSSAPPSFTAPAPVANRFTAAPAPVAEKPPPQGMVPLKAPPPRVEEDAPPVAKVAGSERTIRVNVEILDVLGMVAGDVLVESARSRLRAEELEQLLERFSGVGEKLLRHSERLEQTEPAREELDRLESDLHLLRDDAFRFLRRNADGINALHGNLVKLGDSVAEARLVPLSTVFEAFPRAVREMARSQGKEVHLKIENADVGVDRSLLADVRDALIHILRNAVDHGIETAEARAAFGKPGAGRILIRVRADGDMLHISMEDDGRGLDPEKIRATAVKRGVLTEQRAAALSEREALELIFLAGFSTRDEVSDLSGRGVGLDVVKRKVENLGGSVSVTSKVGLGTTFALRLPQSLALMKVLLVRLGDDVYGVPAADVEAVTRLRPGDRMEVAGTVAIMHRGKPIALVALGPLLALNGGPRTDRPPVVVLRHGEDCAAVVVDGFVDEREVPVKPCGGDFLKGAPFIAGTAALEDGRVAVLLHVPDVMAEVRKMARPVTQAVATRRLKILLVDDSPIARATESALVKALGHTVDEAQDGEEGYAMAQRQTYDLVLSDVQMPRLDGFGLTRRLKADRSLSHLPVIILSSLAAPEDKRRGLDAGADAYLVKGELGVESLAQAIDRLT